MVVESLKQEITKAVTMALCEDLGASSYNELSQCKDITAELIPPENRANAFVITREDCVVCGVAWVDEVFKQLDEVYKTQTQIIWRVKDGDKVSANSTLFELSGNARILLLGERTALNFLQTLSATSTVTDTYVGYLKNTKTQLLDTRKTIPGLRLAQKYAVTCGGGVNHRVGLYDAFLIKENHLVACGGIAKAIEIARLNHPTKKVEVEVENLHELAIALEANADIVMLDNFTPVMIEEAVAFRQSLSGNETKFEVSGNMNLATLTDYAKSGVDYISVGALTKHIQAIDLSMRFN